MRVLHFYKTYWPETFGGVERVVHALAEGGVVHAIEASVLTLSTNPAPSPQTFGNHKIFQVKCDLDIASTRFSWGAFGKFRALSRKADVIHYHFPWPFMDVVDLMTPHGKPVVVSYHSDVVKQKHLLKLYTPLMHRFLDRADKIVASSPNYAASSSVLQRHAEKTQIITNGLDSINYPAADTTRLEYWKSRFPDGFFLFVGVLRYYKGIHILIEAARRSGLPVVLLGGGDNKKAVQSEITSKGINNIHILGAKPDEDKIALLTLCRALVFPSHLRSEAFGLSLVEASMHAKPMISCEIGTGTSYVNLDGETGIVIPPADPDKLVEAMQRLWLNHEECQRFGQAARKRYISHFTAKRMVCSYAALYQSLLK